MTGHCWRRRTVLWITLALSPLLASARPQTARPAAQTATQPTTQSANAATVRQLYQARAWSEVVRAVPLRAQPMASAELLRLRALALAHLNRLAEADQTLTLALRAWPRDEPLLVELAGVRYRQHRPAQAARLLRRALRLDSSDSYARNFLGTVELLQGNLEAALAQWNRVARPVLAESRIVPEPKLPPLLLDRIAPFAPGGVWTLDAYRHTQSELALQPLFAATSDELRPLPYDSANGGRFARLVQTVPHPGWRSEPLASALSTLRELPYQAVDPEFWNLAGSATSLTSYLRWDAQKRMVLASVGGPLHSPDQRLHLDLDARNENWNLAQTLYATSATPQTSAGSTGIAGLNQERVVAGVGLDELFGWRWLWQTEGEFSRRRFRSLAGLPTGSAYFTDSSAMALRSGLRVHLVDAPEHRLRMDGSADAEAERYFTRPLTHAVRLTAGLDEQWLPQPSGDRYRLHVRQRAGQTIGSVPFDQLWMLGFDRDNPLWMRGHNGLANGRKGAAPLGTRYALGNVDFDRLLWRDPFVSVRMGPFVDTGRVYSGGAEASVTEGAGGAGNAAAQIPLFGARRWMTDTGLQTRLHLFTGATLVMGWGHDLRSGANTFYSAISH